MFRGCCRDGPLCHACVLPMLVRTKKRPKMGKNWLSRIGDDSRGDLKLCSWHFCYCLFYFDFFFKLCPYVCSVNIEFETGMLNILFLYENGLRNSAWFLFCGQIRVIVGHFVRLVFSFGKNILKRRYSWIWFENWVRCTWSGKTIYQNVCGPYDYWWRIFQ